MLFELFLYILSAAVVIFVISLGLRDKTTRTFIKREVTPEGGERIITTHVYDCTLQYRKELLKQGWKERRFNAFLKKF